MERVRFLRAAAVAAVAAPGAPAADPAATPAMIAAAPPSRTVRRLTPGRIPVR
ncbi:hypothetical protein [Clavibacter michiganensis]|nr:hypothetical protein [Clavibacter michiganensis]